MMYVHIHLFHVAACMVPLASELDNTTHTRDNEQLAEMTLLVM